MCVVWRDHSVNGPDELIEITGAVRSLSVMDCNEITPREWRDVRRFIRASGEEPPKRRSRAEVKKYGCGTG